MTKLEWLLSGILAVLLVVVLALLLRFWLGRSEAPAAEEAEQAQVIDARTALSSYQAAQPVAQQWAADAELLNARAAWPEGDSFDPEAAAWNFVFFSPGQSATALISVSQNRAQLINNRQIDRGLNIFGATGWQIDSPQLLAIVLENGGRDFLEEYGQSKLTLKLDAEDEFVWRARLINTDVPASLTLHVDPGDGEIIASEQSP